MCLRWIKSVMVFIDLLLLTRADTDILSLNTTGIRAACNSLRLSLGSQIVQVAGEEYQLGASSAWSYFNTELHPTCIVFPLNVGHVQAAMRAIFAEESHYAVQAGGHSAMVGWNNIQNGVLIHFKNMQHASYDADRDTITLEPGIHWAEAQAAVEPFGVAPIGGRVNTVGAGLLLGGGFSYLAAAHGYSADAYKELDVVLVNGEFVTATATNKYADLLRALKGGANRFGIVTRYEVEAVHTGTNEDKTWFGGTIYVEMMTITFLQWDISNAELVLKALTHYVRDVKDPNAALLVVLSFAPIIFGELFYNGPELPPSIYGELLSIPQISSESSLGPLSYIEVANNPLDSNDGGGQLFGSSALSNDEALYLNVYERWSNFSETFQDDLGPFVVLAFTPVLESQILAGREKGRNAIDPPLEAYCNAMFQVSFSPGVTAAEIPEDLERGRQLFFEQVPRSPGLPLFVNECDAKQNVFETYGGYEFLKRTYAKYDPTRFNVRHTKGPKGL